MGLITEQITNNELNSNKIINYKKKDKLKELNELRLLLEKNIVDNKSITLKIRQIVHTFLLFTNKYEFYVPNTKYIHKGYSSLKKKYNCNYQSLKNVVNNVSLDKKYILHKNDIYNLEEERRYFQNKINFLMNQYEDIRKLYKNIQNDGIENIDFNLYSTNIHESLRPLIVPELKDCIEITLDIRMYDIIDCIEILNLCIEQINEIININNTKKDKILKYRIYNFFQKK